MNLCENKFSCLPVHCCSEMNTRSLQFIFNWSSIEALTPVVPVQIEQKQVPAQVPNKRLLSKQADSSVMDLPDLLSKGYLESALVLNTFNFAVIGWYWLQRFPVGLFHQALRRMLTWSNSVSHVMVLRKCSSIGS